MSARSTGRHGTTAGAAVAAARRASVMRLRQAGASHGAIAAQLGISKDTAWKDEQYELAKLAKQAEGATLRYRELEVLRLDHYLMKLNSAIEAGKLDAINTAIRLSESRRRLLGLDEPTKIDWRKGAEEAGLDPDALLDDVKRRLRAAVLTGAVGGSTDGSSEGTA